MANNKKKLDSAGLRKLERHANADYWESTDCLRAIYTDAVEGDDLDLSAERARLAKEQADRVSMENAVKRKELVPVAVMTVALARVSAQVAARLDGVPGRLKIRMRHWQQADFDAIEEEITTARNLAAAVTVEAEDLGSSDDTDSDS